MKKYLLLCLLVFAVFSANAQDVLLSTAHNCYERGDYDCAREYYQKYLQKFPNHAEAKALRKKAGECSILKLAADDAYLKRNYREAFKNYRELLDINPYDSYAEDRWKRCNEIINPEINLNVSSQELTFNSQGGVKNITINTNTGRYEIKVTFSWFNVEVKSNSFIITCDPNSTGSSRSGYFTVTAGNKTKQININQSGKVSSAATKQRTTLSVSSDNISFFANGGRATMIVTTNANEYQVAYSPSWCKPSNKYSNWFTLACDANNGEQRKDRLKITAADKEIWVEIIQDGIAASRPNKAGAYTIVSSNYPDKPKHKPDTEPGKCINCPTNNYSWGISLAYVRKTPNYSYYHYNTTLEGIQLGIRFEPLFKYGFGLNMGLFYEYYSKSYEYEYREQVLNLPFHLEYRLYFSKHFNLFAYGGLGVDMIANSSLNNLATNTLLEYGGGLRIDHVQFNLAKSARIGNSKDEAASPWNAIIYPDYRKWVISVAYVF